jgi:hypothetical protein
MRVSRVLAHLRFNLSGVLLIVAMSVVLGAATSERLPATVSNVLAYNCPIGPFWNQLDTFSGSRHGWLGYCAGLYQAMVYSGEDDAGATLSGQTVHLRQWCGGILCYDNTLTVYNQTWDGLSSPVQWTTSVQGDSSSTEWINGQWSWSWYLHM